MKIFFLRSKSFHRKLVNPKTFIETWCESIKQESKTLYIQTSSKHTVMGVLLNPLLIVTLAVMMMSVTYSLTTGMTMY